jgi:hypothetical protein
MIATLKKSGTYTLRETIAEALWEEPADLEAVHDSYCTATRSDAFSRDAAVSVLVAELRGLMAEGVVAHRYGLYFLTPFGRACRTSGIRGSEGGVDARSA